MADIDELQDAIRQRRIKQAVKKGEVVPEDPDDASSNLSDPKAMALFNKFFKLKRVSNFKNLFTALEGDSTMLSEIGKFCKDMESYLSPEKAEQLEQKVNSLQKKLKGSHEHTMMLEENIASLHEVINELEEKLDETEGQVQDLEKENNKLKAAGGGGGTTPKEPVVAEKNQEPPKVEEKKVVKEKRGSVLFSAGAPISKLGVQTTETSSQTDPVSFGDSKSSTTTSSTLSAPKLGGPPSLGAPTMGAPPKLGGPPSLGAPPTLGAPKLGAPPSLGGPPKLGAPPSLGAPSLGGPPKLGGPPSLGAPPTLGGPPKLGGPPSLGGPPKLGGPPSLGGGPPKLGGPPSLGGGPPALGGGGPPKLGAPGGLGLGPPSLVPQEKPKNVKRVFIDALAAPKIEGTVFAMLKESKKKEIKFDELEKKFENAPAKKAPMPAKGGEEEKPKAKKGATCILPDAKRAYQANIMVNKFRKYTWDQVRQAILDLDPKMINTELATTLVPYAPQPEEITACSNWNGDNTELDAASNFMVAVHNIPRFVFRLRAFVFKAEFNDKLDEALSNIRIFNKGCKLVKDSEKFQHFLGYTLQVANFLNAGTNRGNAHGFKIKSVLSFNGVKSSDGKASLLEYVITVIDDENPETMQWVKDFKIVNDLSKMNLDELVRDVDMIKSQMSTIKVHLDSSEKSNPKDEGFINTFRKFYDDNLPAVQDADKEAKECKAMYQDTCKFYGEDDESLKKITSEEYWGLFKQITDTIGQINEKVLKMKKMAANKK